MKLSRTDRLFISGEIKIQQKRKNCITIENTSSEQIDERKQFETIVLEITITNGILDLPLGHDCRIDMREPGRSVGA